MNNHTVAKNWRQQTGKGHTGSNMYYVGKTIYSYGSHFPMAYITGLTYGEKAIILQNADGYSVSTSKHLGYMRSQCYDDAIIEITTGMLKRLIDEWEGRQSPTTDTLLDASREIRTRMAEHIEKYNRARARKVMYEALIENDRQQLSILESI